MLPVQKFNPAIVKAYLNIEEPDLSLGEIAARIKFYKTHPDAYNEIANPKGLISEPTFLKIGAKKGPAPKKPGTIAAQIKDLNPGEAGPITTPFNQRDIEIAGLMSSIKFELKKKCGSTWNDAYNNSMKAILTNVKKAPDALEFLKRALLIINPNPITLSAKAKLKPGEYGAVAMPSKLSPTAQGFMPKGDEQKRAAELVAKIKEFEDEIARLKAAQKKAEKSAEQAKIDKANLAPMDEKLLKYFSYIEEHCSEYLKHVRSTGKLLYRGQSDASQPIFVGYPRADRKPKDSNKKAQELCDKYLTLKGFKALRSNSIFTSSNKSQAGRYGDVYAIFPKNGFKYLWSTKDDDLVLNSVTQLTSGSNDNDDEASEVFYKYYQSEFFHWLEWIEYNVDDTVDDAFAQWLLAGDKEIYKTITAQCITSLQPQCGVSW